MAPPLTHQARASAILPAASSAHSAPRTIAIIGAGFSGSILAVNLLRTASSHPLEIILIERAPRFSRGTAYSTDSPVHLLNVPAARMSAFPSEPNHFLDWVQLRDLSILPDAFLPRRLYGSYLEQTLDHAQFSAPPHIQLRRIPAQAIAIDAPSAANPRAAIHLHDQTFIRADHIILALGNFAPADPLAALAPNLPSSAYTLDPWSPTALLNLAPEDPILIIGTGLTMIDVVLRLHHENHRGPIFALSRHGLLPQPHRSPGFPPKYRLNESAVKNWPANTLQLLRLIRAEIRDAAQHGEDWREVINALRPVTQHLWASLPVHEQSRFLRHHRHFWDIHRHRVPASAWETFQRLQSAGQITLIPGRITAVTQNSNSLGPNHQNAKASDGHFSSPTHPLTPSSSHLLTVSIHKRGASQPYELSIARIINCTGPQSDVTRLSDQLIKNLLASNLIQPDAHRLGILANSAGSVLNAGNQPQPWLHTLGPLMRGGLWESTAVPELRTQASALAAQLVNQVTSHTAT